MTILNNMENKKGDPSFSFSKKKGQLTQTQIKKIDELIAKIDELLKK